MIQVQNLYKLSESFSIRKNPFEHESISQEAGFAISAVEPQSKDAADFALLASESMGR
jgi:hypothetical protein